MTYKKDDKQIKREFQLRQTRQIVAIAAALFLVLLLAVIAKRPDLFGAFSKGALFGGQIAVSAAFFAFTAVNWKCPACSKHLGSDIFRQHCKKCGVRLR